MGRDLLLPRMETPSVCATLLEVSPRSEQCLLLATFYDRLIRGGSSGENPRGKSETENISDFAWLFWKRRVSVLANCKQHLYTKIGKYLEKNHCQHAGNT